MRIIIAILFLLIASPSWATVLFSDNFDSHADWGPATGTTPIPTGYYDVRNSNIVYGGEPNQNIKGGAGFFYGASGKAYVKYQESTTDAACAQSVQCSDALLGASFTATQEIYIGHQFKLQSGWQWATYNIYGGFMKILHASHLTGADIYEFHNDDDNVPRFVPVYQRENEVGGHVRMYAITHGGNNEEVYWNPGNGWNASEDGDPANSVGCGTPCLAYNTWHTIVYRLKNNTKTGSTYNYDGILEVWINGTLEFRKTTIRWTNSTNISGGDPANYGWNHVWLGGNNYNNYNFGGAEQWYAVDNFIVATTKAEVDTFLTTGSSGGDTTAPTVTSASIGTNGVTVTVNFSETVVSTGYDNGDFNLDCSVGGNDIALNSVAGTGSTRTFSAAKTIGVGETCNLDYTGSTDDMEDAAGNDLATFSNLSVTNGSTQDITVPEVSSAVISTNGTTVTITFSETVVTTGYDNGDFNLDCSSSGTDISLNSISGTGTSRTFTAASTIAAGDTCNLDYLGTTDEIQDSAGNDLAVFSNMAVTNNSTKDTYAPTVTAFVITPTSYTGWVLPIATFTATDTVGVTGYCINESATPPTAETCSGSGWSATAQTIYSFTTAGSKTLYAWAKDGDGNISSSLNDTVTIVAPVNIGISIPGGVRIQ